MSLDHTFLICCYPRSRSYWLAEFFSLPGVCHCDHEASGHATSSAQFWANAEGCGEQNYGNSDSGNIFVLPALLASRPLTKVIWIERPMEEVAASMEAAGFSFTRASQDLLCALKERYRDYFDIEIAYEDLARGQVISELWNFLLPEAPFDFGRWGIMDSMRVSKDVRYYERHPVQVARLINFIAHEGEFQKCLL